MGNTESTTLMEACISNDLNAVRKLLKKGCVVNYYNIITFRYDMPACIINNSVRVCILGL